MKRYPINEIFYSLQGEGVNAGCPAVFVRFSGCNLKCPFCDTDHHDATAMSADEIIECVSGYTPCRLVVLTGGEPSLYIDDNLIGLLCRHGYDIAIETNGTNMIPDGINHVTLSPKDEFCEIAEVRLKRCDELKVVYTGDNNPLKYDWIKTGHRVLQPCDTGDPDKNRRLIAEAMQFCLRHPEWRLSLQLHKILDIK